MPFDHEPDFELHYSIRELAKLWHLSYESVRQAFEREPGILRIEHKLRKNKRGYTSMRIPASVARKVYKRLTSGRRESAA
jgi:hypothetical protein